MAEAPENDRHAKLAAWLRSATTDTQLGGAPANALTFRLDQSPEAGQSESRYPIAHRPGFRGGRDLRVIRKGTNQ